MTSTKTGIINVRLKRRTRFHISISLTYEIEHADKTSVETRLVRLAPKTLIEISFHDNSSLFPCNLDCKRIIGFPLTLSSMKGEWPVIYELECGTANDYLPVLKGLCIKIDIEKPEEAYLSENMDEIMKEFAKMKSAILDELDLIFPSLRSSVKKDAKRRRKSAVERDAKYYKSVIADSICNINERGETVFDVEKILEIYGTEKGTLDKASMDASNLDDEFDTKDEEIIQSEE